MSIPGGGLNFHRKAAVTLTKPVPDSFFHVDGNNSIVITDLRIKFKVDKHTGKEPNTCEITITNLAQRTRVAVQQKPLQVRLDAGYEGNLRRLFIGDLLYAYSERVGASWNTVLQVGDGARAYQYARVNRSLGPATAMQALQQISTSLGLPLPSNIQNAPELLKQYASGISLEGPAQRELDRVLTATGFEWSIQDGRLQILRPTDTRADEAILLSSGSDGGPRSGMIGSPSFGAPTNDGKPPVLKVKNQLYPEVTPGGRIKVVSQYITGVFRVEKNVSTGDTRGKEWYSEIESRAVA